MTAPAPVTLTDSAVARLRGLLAQNEGAAGIKLNVVSQGCSGMSYHMDFADEPIAGADVVESEDGSVRLYVEPAAVMYILGTEIDFVEDRMQTGFVFNNPNEKGRCGCGSSFTV